MSGVVFKNKTRVGLLFHECSWPQQKLITHTTKLTAENPTDSSETQLIKVLYKNSGFESSLVDQGKIK